MIILDSIVEAARSLPPDKGGAMLIGVADYMARCIESKTTDGIEPPFVDDPILYAFFLGMKVSIDKSLKKQINGSIGGSANRSESERVATDEKPRSKRKAKHKQTPTEGKEEGKGKGDESDDSSDSSEIPYEAIVARLNERAGTRFRADSAQTRSMINGRFAEGYTLDDFFHVIDVKCSQWNREPRPGEKDMRSYLRPKTLFAPGNFESYVNEEVVSRGVDLGQWAKPDGSAF